MRTVIINQFSPERVNYKKALKDINTEVVLLTKNKHVNAYKEMFENTIGFDNFDNNDRLYSYIIDLNKNEKIDYIVATHEFDLVKAGQLRDFIGVEGQNSESAISFRDKYVMKQKVHGAIQTPSFERTKNVFDLIKFKEQHGYPFIVKPVDGAGSVGVQVIKDDQEFNDLLENGVFYGWIAETFIDGDMYHVDGLYENGKLLFSQPSIYLNGCLAFQEGNYLGSSMIDKKNPMFNRLNESVMQVLSVLPTPNHAIAFHAEFFHTKENDIVFCEIASRVGGGMISECIEATKGIDILNESIRAQCGMVPDVNLTSDSLGGFIIIPPKEGTLVSINVDFPYEWVVDCYTKADYIGKKFDGSSSSVDSVASIVVKGETEEEVHNRLLQVYDWFEQNSKWDLK